MGDDVTLTIDGRVVTVAAGTLVIRAAEALGVEIPRFCDHPLLQPVGACRQCLVDIPDAGNGRAFPKPQASCTIAVAPGMVVKTSTASASKAQAGVLEFLLLNHPLDCPVCDKGGECPLQNQAMSNGNSESRFEGVKRTYAKPIPVSDTILLDRERCVLCQRCTRFAEEIADDARLVLTERGSHQQVSTVDGEPFDSPYSGNIIDLCPVGALTSADYRFRARPFDLVSTNSIGEHDACGSALRVDHRRGRVLRRVSRDDNAMPHPWITDRDRFGFEYLTRNRLTTPLVRESGELRTASWPEAIDVAAKGLMREHVGVLVGGSLTLEDTRAYAWFGRQILRTEDIDFRETATQEESSFLRSVVAGSRSVSYNDLLVADAVFLVGLDPRTEAGAIDLCLIRAERAGVQVHTHATSIAAATDRSVILVGRSAANTPGLISATAAAAAKVRAKLAWVPRRAGDRGAVEAGALPMPGGRDVGQMAEAVSAGVMTGLLLAGVKPTTALESTARRTFSVCLEIADTALTQTADVVFPVAAAAEKAGTFVNWEGRERAFEQVIETGRFSDARVLEELATRISEIKRSR